MSDTTESNDERPCLHCLIGEVIDDFYAEYGSLSGEQGTIDVVESPYIKVGSTPASIRVRHADDRSSDRHLHSATLSRPASRQLAAKLGTMILALVPPIARAVCSVNKRVSAVRSVPPGIRYSEDTTFRRFSF
jgi:hypothetical protein